MIPPWLIWSGVAVVCWGAWAFLPRLIGESLTPAQSQALSTIGLIPVMAWLLGTRNGRRTVPSRRGCGIAFAAGLASCAGNVAYYRTLNLGGTAASVVSVTALYPLVTVFLAMLFLRERLNWIQWAGILLSLASIAVFNIATVEGLASRWLVYAMLPIACWGVAGLLQKISTTSIDGELSTLWFLTAFVPAGVVLLALEPLRGLPSTRLWGLALAVGFFFAAGNLALLVAFAKGGQASVVTPLTGLYPLVSIPIAIVALGESVAPREWLGISLALVAVVALAWETRIFTIDEKHP